MIDNMGRNLASATSEEKTSIKEYKRMMAATEEEANALTASIQV